MLNGRVGGEAGLRTQGRHIGRNIIEGRTSREGRAEIKKERMDRRGRIIRFNREVGR